MEQFASQDLTVKVSTNNERGYKLYASADGNNLIKTDDDSTYIENIASETTEANFPTNFWGSKINSNVLTQADYRPFVSGVLISKSFTATNGDNSTFTFAAKADTAKPAGTYALDLKFEAVVNPSDYPFIQDITKSVCQSNASSSNIYVMDKRDYNVYTIRYINGYCWMTSDLQYDITTYETTPETSNISATYPAQPAAATFAATYTDPVDYVYDNRHFYNYCALSAGTVCKASGGTSISYDICPKNWQTPSSTEANALSGHLNEFDYAGGYINQNGEYKLGDRGYYRLRDYGSAYGIYGLYIYNNSSMDAHNDNYVGKLTLSAARCILK